MTPLCPAGDAIFSPCGRYRYRLDRRWDPARPTLGVVMLNPSTADAARDDPTIRRCINLAARAGFGAIAVANLFAFRATLPADLKAARDPIGPENDRHLAEMFASRGAILAAWGVHGAHIGRADAAIALATRHAATLFCLGRTAKGQPRHPLYVRRDCAFLPFAG